MKLWKELKGQYYDQLEDQCLVIASKNKLTKLNQFNSN